MGTAIILDDKEIEHLIEALHCTLHMFKEKDPENAHLFSPPYQDLKDKLEGIQNSVEEAHAAIKSEMDAKSQDNGEK